MPDSEAVYQPTTVGYTYEHGGEGNDVNGGARIRSGFSRIIFRHKVSTRKWLEWVLLSVAFCATVAGLATILVNLVTSEGTPVIAPGSQDGTAGSSGDDKVKDKINDSSRGSLAVGFFMTFLGMSMGVLWVWLHFFRHGGKAQRGGMSRASGQMLGGLNPSTDLLVGSTSQYGPVLTEVPSQMTDKQIVSDTRVIPMSDHEEETHTLMQDAGVLLTAIQNGQGTPISQIPA